MTSKDRSKLKGIAQSLKATFQIGAGELHKTNLDAIELAFNNRELVKVKVNRVDKTDKKIVRDIATKIEQLSDIQVVDVIGTTIILYKKNKKEELNLL